MEPWTEPSEGETREAGATWALGEPASHSQVNHTLIRPEQNRTGFLSFAGTFVGAMELGLVFYTRVQNIQL